MRSRSFSKPTREEWEAINEELSTKDADTLRSYIKLAIGESPELASLIMRFLSVKPESNLLQERWSLKRHPPPDEDCNMSGIENQCQSMEYNAFEQQSTIFNRKRKSLSDRDINVPTIAFTSKRHRVREASWGAMALCANCGNVFGEQQSNLHDCVYHTGTLVVERDPHINETIYADTFLRDTQGSRWTCCRADGASPGCLTTRHSNAATASKSAYFWVKQRRLLSTRS